MYNLTLRGTTGPEADIVAARVYVNGGPAIEVAAGPNAVFTASAAVAGSGSATVEHSFVDAAGNEGARRSQTIVIPDVAAPLAPTADLELVSIVWA